MKGGRWWRTESKLVQEDRGLAIGCLLFPFLFLPSILPMYAKREREEMAAQKREKIPRNEKKERSHAFKKKKKKNAHDTFTRHISNA